MYGMVNKALQEMVTSGFGDAVWERVKTQAGIDIDVFISNDGYPDDITYRLVGAVSQVLDIPGPEVLRKFGRHWILKTARDGYGELINAGGSNISDFLENLPNFHARVSLIFPHLDPPKFVCTDTRDGFLRLHYFSDREGLSPFLVGLLDGLGEQFNTPVRIEQEVERGKGSDHDIFAIEWDRSLT